MIDCLHILGGRAGSGKSEAVAAMAAALQRAGGRAIVIVPEQYTYETERALSDRAGGLLGIQVLSFQRLAERVLEQNGMERPFLSPQGYRMVVRRAAYLRAGAKELAVFSHAAEQQGFAAEMAEIFANAKRACLTPELLRAAAEKLPPESMLRGKLTDIALLYADTEEYLSERYLTADDAFNAAVALLPQSFVQGVPVFIDGPDRPDGQGFRLLGALMDAAGSMTVTLRLDGEAPGGLFAPDEETRDRLIEMATARGVPVEVRELPAPDREGADAVGHFSRYLFSERPVAFTGPYGQGRIKLFGASDRRAETEALGDAILDCARSGVRFREMAVIVSDMAAYAGLIERAFSKRGIPVFLDRKRPVTGHAAADAVLTAVRCVSDGYRPEDVLRLVKTGFAGVRDADGDAFENFLLRTGLRGTALTRPFRDAPEDVERARAAVMGPLCALQAGLKAPTAGGKARAVYAYVKGIALDAQLSATASALLSEGRIPLMEEHAQVWRVLMDALSQIDAILGDVPLPRALFYALLKEGLDGYAIGVIPDTADQVLLGDAARTRSRAVRALFVVGLNEGLLPVLRAPDGLIDDRELTALRELGCPTWRLSRERQAADDLELYTAFSKARETVRFSYAFSAGGEELAPSPLVVRLRALFPALTEESDVMKGDTLPACAAAGLDALTQALSAYRAGDEPSPLLPALLRYYQGDARYGARVKRMLDAGRGRPRTAPLDAATARVLYGSRLRMSASRLETFNGCPFRHFVRYGLYAETRREYTEKAEDLGTFYHAVLEAFVHEVMARGLRFMDMTDADADAVTAAVLPGVIAAHNGGIFLSNERLHATLFLVTDTVKAGARAVVRQLAAGAFTPRGTEVCFGDGEAFPPLVLRLPDGTEARLSGKIDRVDAARVQGQDCLRVVDYKTGGRDFDYAGVLNGLTLQLPLYLAAATAQGGEAAGMYYMALRPPVIKEDPAAAASPMDAVQAALRLQGVTVEKAEILRASERGMDGDSRVLGGVKRTDGGDDGADAYTGSLVSQGEMAALLTAARQRSEQTLSDMLGGEIAAHPFEGACKYCDYRTVCRFDPTVRGCRTRKADRVKAEAFFLKIGGGDAVLE